MNLLLQFLCKVFSHSVIKVVLSVNVTLCFQSQTILKRKQDILEGYESNPSNERKRLCCRSSQEELNLLMWDCAIIINFGTIKVILLLKSNNTLQLCLFFNIFIKQSL